MAKPRIVLYDLETMFNVVAAFRLFNEDGIPHRNILQERYIVSFAWKELDEKTVHATSILDYPDRFAKDRNDDSEVLKKLHEVMSSADVLVAHNGDAYDQKFAETRMVIKGLPTLPPIPSIDTLKIAKARFNFNSNRLDYLGQVLGFGHKKSNEEDLWLKVLAGDVKAIRNMVAYNKQDIVLLEQVFRKFQPYMPNYINRQLFTLEPGIKCPVCGSAHYEHRGFRYAQTKRYRRFQCLDCGKWFKDRKAEPFTPPIVGL